MLGRNFSATLVQLVVGAYLSTINCTSAAEKFLPDIKELFDKPLEEKKRRSRYEIIYKRIDIDYYGYRNDEDDIVDKFEWLTEEGMRVTTLREWQRIMSMC